MQVSRIVETQIARNWKKAALKHELVAPLAGAIPVMFLIEYRVAPEIMIRRWVHKGWLMPPVEGTL